MSGTDLSNDFIIYTNFEKADEEKRMVYGYATTDALDSQDEIVEMGATAMAVEDYRKWANIREMHTNSAVGIAPIIEIRKDGLWLGAHIVDDRAWGKVKKGVYKGFSIGGKKLDVIQEFNEELGKTINRIKKYMLTEISLVDRPANPLATFSFIKRDTDTNEVKLMKDLKKEVTPEVEEQPVAEIKKEAEAEAVEEATETKEEEVAEVKEEAVEEKVEESKPEEKEVVSEEAEKSVLPDEMVSIKKSEYEALVKEAALVKKQDELIDLIKANIEKSFTEEEPKELVQKAEKEMAKSIGELSVGKGGWLAME